MNHLTASSALVTALLLAACGGSNDSPDGEVPQPPPAPVQTTAEGIWTGNSPVGGTKGLDASLLVLENGEAWGIVGLDTLTETLHGTLSSADGKISGSSAPGTPAYSYSGTYTPRVSMDARLGPNFVGTYASTYDRPASLAAFIGSHWVRGKATTAAPWFVTLSELGVLRVVPARGCEGTGGLTPRASGKNVFDVSVGFSGEGCTSLGLGSSSSPRMKGVAWQDGTRLIVMGLKTEPEPLTQRRSGFVFTVNPPEVKPAPPPTPLPPAEPLVKPTGFWTGTLPTGRELTLLVLEGGDTWGHYRRPDGSLVWDSVLHGTTSWADGQLSGSGVEAGILSGGYSGSYTPSGRMQMQFQEGAFSGSYTSQLPVQPVTLAAIAGQYSGDVGLNISESGNFTLMAGFCTGGGKVTATATAGGQQIFHVSFVMRSGVYSCTGPSFPGQWEGVMYYENGSLTIMAVGTDAQQSLAAASRNVALRVTRAQ